MPDPLAVGSRCHPHRADCCYRMLLELPCASGSGRKDIREPACILILPLAGSKGIDAKKRGLEKGDCGAGERGCPGAAGSDGVAGPLEEASR